MKIVFLTGNLCDGGAQRVISVLANELAGMGHEIMVIVFAKADKEYPLNSNVVRITLYHSYAEYKKVSAFRRLKRIRKILREFEPNVAVGFIESGYALFLSSIGLHFLKIGSLRISPYIQGADKSLRGRLERLWFRKASAVVLQTDGQKEYALWHGWSEPTVIANPINVSVFLLEEHCYKVSCCRLVMAGRLTAQKNYPLAFKALKRVGRVIPEWKLEIYGRGELADELADLVAHLGLQDKISFKGWVDDVISAYQQSDLFLMTSDFEGLPNVLMEAMGCGLPCISTDCPTGPADLIENGVNGVLVPVNDVDALADAIIKVCTMPLEERANMGCKARRFIMENYSAGQIADQWVALVERLEKKHGRYPER